MAGYGDIHRNTGESRTPAPAALHDAHIGGREASEQIFSLLVSDAVGRDEIAFIRSCNPYTLERGLREGLLRLKQDARDSRVRSLIEESLAPRLQEFSCAELSRLLKSYRLAGLRREGADLLGSAFDDEGTLPTEDSVASSLALLRELSLQEAKEHDLVDVLVRRVETSIDSLSHERLCELLRALGRCHTDRTDLFERGLTLLTPSLEGLSPKNVTRMMMGWVEMNVSAPETLGGVLRHFEERLAGYVPEERAIMLRAFSLLLPTEEFAPLAERVVPGFTNRISPHGAGLVAKALAYHGLEPSGELAPRVKDYRAPKGPPLSDETVRALRLAAKRVDVRCLIRHSLWAASADYFIPLEDGPVAIIVDAPWETRLGGFSDGALSGSERMRDKILARQGLRVLRVDEDLLIDGKVTAPIGQFLATSPSPGVYDVAARPEPQDDD